MQLNYICNKNHQRKDVDEIFDEYTDVCVVGLGTSGSLAAICAAKMGVKVLGIEKMSAMGGAGTNGGVYDYFHGSAEGEFEQINEQCFAMIENGYLSSDRFENKNSIPGFIKARILEDTALQYGCVLYYQTSVTGVFVQDNKVVGLQIFKDNQLINVAAKIVIDCTGEAYICRLCGCEFMSGRPWDNQLMRFSKAVGMLWENYQVAIWYNYDFINIHDAMKYSEKVLESMTIPVVLRGWYDEQNKVLFESSCIGLRECYCVETEETYTFSDFINGKQQKENLFFAQAPLDNTNHDIAFESSDHQDWFLLSEMSDCTLSLGVSKNMMIPKGIDGLLIAAKGIGIGHDLSGMIRMKKDMEKCGECAGIIAALAVQSSISVRGVSYESIIRHLSWKIRIPGANSFYSAEEGDIKKGLSASHCGHVLWAVRTMDRETIVPKLLQWLKEDQESLRKNSAIALGMLGDKSGLCCLRKIVRTISEIPEEIPKGRYYLDFSKAITLIGRLKDGQCIDDLFDIMDCDGKKYSVNLKVGGYYRTISQYECNFVSLAITALLSIATDSVRRHEIWQRIIDWTLREREDEELEKLRKTVIAGLECRREDIC